MAAQRHSQTRNLKVLLQTKLLYFVDLTIIYLFVTGHQLIPWYTALPSSSNTTAL